jgi:hypothetical protein
MAPELADIQLEDVSGHLGASQHVEAEELPPWERDLPFNLPILAPSSSNEQPKPWKLDVGDIKSLSARLRNPPPAPSLPQLRRFTGELESYDYVWGGVLSLFLGSYSRV